MGTATARLEVVAGKASGTMIVVDGELVIGRHADGAGRLAGDEEISRAHARVSIEGATCSIEDLGSTNGTYVNGLRISAPRPLALGDAVELGGTTLVVRELPPTETADPATADQPTLTGRVAAAEPAPADEPPAGDAAAAVEQPAAAEEPTAAHEPAAPDAMAAMLSLRLEVDFDAHEARIFLTDNSDPVRLVFEQGAWRPAPASAAEKGSTQ